MTRRRREPRAVIPEDDGTVSGLDERQIDAADLETLRAACRLNQLLPEPAAGVGQRETLIDLGALRPSLNAVELAIAEPVSQRIRIAPLPKRSKINRAALPLGLIRVRRNLKLALRQPIRRSKLRLGELKAAQQKELYRKLFEKYGRRAEEITVEAVFAHVPPEGAQSARLSEDFESLEFKFPANTSPRGVVTGQYLVVLSDRLRKTWSVLLRL
jgi:hypothetical protein